MKIGTLALPLFPILGFILTILKALGTINISWFWATAAFWMPAAAWIVIMGAVLLATLLFAALCGIVGYFLDKK